MRRKRRFVHRVVRMAVMGLCVMTLGFAIHVFVGPRPPLPAPLPVDESVSKQANIITSVIPPVPLPIAPALVLSADSVEQGDTLAVAVANLATGTLRGTFAGVTIPFFSYGEGAVAVLGIPAQKEPGSYLLSIAVADRNVFVQEVEVKARKFPVTELKTTPELEEQGHTPVAISQNVAVENMQLKSAFISIPGARFTQPFVYPLDRIEVVGAYGNVRVSGGVGMRHYGVDLEATMGTSVHAMNDGVVRLAKRFTDYGNTILIDHGAHIFSMYLHLSEFKVNAGDTVRRGEVIGLSGNTGYSLAPHLHFSVNVGGVSVDSLRFIEAVNRVLSPDEL